MVGVRWLANCGGNIGAGFDGGARALTGGLHELSEMGVGKIPPMRANGMAPGVLPTDSCQFPGTEP